MDMEVKKKAKSLRYKSKKTRTVIHRTATAAECIGTLEPGLRVTGLTAGQFSLIDAMEHIADELGDARVSVSAWTTGIYDAQRSAMIMKGGRIVKIRMLLDRANFQKSPQFAGPLIEALGVESFRCLSVHAKVVIVEGRSTDGLPVATPADFSKPRCAKLYRRWAGGWTAWPRVRVWGTMRCTCSTPWKA